MPRRAESTALSESRRQARGAGRRKAGERVDGVEGDRRAGAQQTLTGSEVMVARRAPRSHCGL